MVYIRKLILSFISVCLISGTTVASSPTPSEAVKVLSLQGTGLKVLIALRILRQIESLTGKRSYEFFDVIAGDGFGGVVALALGQGKSAEELIGIFESNAHLAFKRKKSGWFKGVKYSTESYENFLRILYGENSISDLRGQILVTARARGLTHIFSNMPGVGGNSLDTSLISVARATSSDISSFSPVKIDKHVFTDSAREEVSPILRAIAAVRGKYADSGIFALSIDSGQLEGRDRPLTETEAGADLMLNVQSNNSAYYRIRSSFRNQSLKFSDSSENAILSYQYDASDTLDYFGARLVEVIKSISRDVRAPDHSSAMIYATSRLTDSGKEMLDASHNSRELIPSPAQRGISPFPLDESKESFFFDNSAPNIHERTQNLQIKNQQSRLTTPRSSALGMGLAKAKLNRSRRISESDDDHA